MHLNLGALFAPKGGGLCFVGAGKRSLVMAGLAGAAMLRRGPLRGMVFIAESLGIRRVVFRGNGMVEDLGVTFSGPGTEIVVGSIGMQP